MSRNRAARGSRREPQTITPPVVIDPTIYGVTSFTTANHYDTANPGGEPGVNTGFGYLALVRVDALSSAFRVLLSRATATAGEGFDLRLNNNVLAGLCSNGAGGNVGAGSYTYVSGDVGKIDAIAFQKTATTIAVYRNKAMVGSAVADASYTVASAATRWGIREGTNGPAASVTILGVLEWEGIATLAQIQAAMDACKAAADIADSIGGATASHSWSVKRSQTGTVPATMADHVGSDALTKNGACTLVSDGAPTWGF